MTRGTGPSQERATPVDSRSIVLHLQTLEDQLAQMPRHAEALDAALTRGDRGTVLRSTAVAERHIWTMALTAGRLKEQVVAANDLGGTVDSLAELGLRAARIVVRAELRSLRELVYPVSEHDLTLDLSWGRFWGIDDLTVCVHTELDRITDEWHPALRRERTERPVFRAGLRSAYVSMRKLGTASEFARFLWEGRQRADWPALQAVCSRMSLALTIRLDVEPETPLMKHVRPLDNYATERAS